MSNRTELSDLEITGSTGTYFIPHVHFNASTGVCLMEGESYHENAWEFYGMLMNWLKEYIRQTEGPVTFNFKLTYFNTSSSKCLLDLMRLLKDYQTQGGKVEAYWYYPEDDLDNLAEAEDFIADTGLDIQLISYEI